jgi:hypothetical protein
LLKLDPQNDEAKKELAVIANALKQVREKEKKVFGGMFAKGGLYDDVKTQEIKPEVKKVESEDEEDEIKHPEEEEEPAEEEAVKEEKVEEAVKEEKIEEEVKEEKIEEGHLKTE